MSNLTITNDTDGKRHLQAKLERIVAKFQDVQNKKVEKIYANYRGKKIGFLWWRKTLETNKEINEWIKENTVFGARYALYDAEDFFGWELKQCRDAIRILKVAISDNVDVILDDKVSTVIGNFDSGVYQRYFDEA